MALRIDLIREGADVFGGGGRLVGFAVRWRDDVSAYRPPYSWPMIGFVARLSASRRRKRADGG
jgi:hypothetical protein